MSTSETMMYGWHTIDWRKLEVDVFKLQTRIYRASSRGDMEVVHGLQRLLMKSHGTALLAVRRVTQDNQGKHTAGVDGISSLTAKEKLELAECIRRNPYDTKVQPLRRVWIPKPGKEEKRPLGIPSMEDRARQALVKMVLEPEWEAKFEPNSYGFRPGRSCHDAIEAIYRQVRLVPKWVLDADIAGCFDHIDHEALLNKIGTYPKLRRVIRAWLKSGILDEGQLFPTSEGTPQGGVISPLLANIALHGMEAAVQAVFPKCQRLQGENRWVKAQPVIIRYADDFVVLHRDREAVERAQQVIAEWLKQVGLEMKPSKTRIVNTLEEHDGQVGFDFLGFHVRQYPRGRSSCIRIPRTGEPVGFTPSIRPSKASQKRLLQDIRRIIRSKKAASQERLIVLLNPIIRGWGNYFSKVVSKDVFQRLDALIFEKLNAWACFRHPDKGRHWIKAKYWSFSEDRSWVFGIPNHIRLISLSDIPIRRHLSLRTGKSPYDGDWVYWSQRLGQYPDVPKSVAIRLRMQEGICTGCGLNFRPDDEMEILHLDGDRRNFQRDNTALVHRRCAAAMKKRVETRLSAEEPYEGKLSRTVLKTSVNGDVHA
jgi:RNA-directed DNA polymerase